MGLSQVLNKTTLQQLSYDRNIFMFAQKLMEASLVYCIEPENKKIKEKQLTTKKTDMLGRNGKQSEVCGVCAGAGNESTVGRISEKKYIVGFKPGVK